MLAECRLIRFPSVKDPRGNLTFIEGAVHVPFHIQRIFYLYDVPGGAERGGHAHRQLEQVLIAASGSFDVVLQDGRERVVYQLNRSYHGLYVSPMIWSHLENFSSGAVCLALASRPYEEIDYFRNFSDYLRELGLGS